MTEYTSFIILFCLAIGAAFFSLKLKFYYIPILFLHFSVVRYAGFDADIEVYASSVYFDLSSVYYWREPFIWYGLQYIFQIVKSIEITFLVFDFVSVLVIYFSFKKINLNVGHFFGFFLLAPVILGYQNIYRQYHSAVFLILLISYLLSNFKRRHWLILLLSSSAHNVSLAFLPMFVIFSQSFTRKLMVMSSLLVYPFLLQLAGTTKSFEANTGANLSILYLVALTLLTIIIFLPFDISSRSPRRAAANKAQLIDIRLSTIICFLISLIGLFTFQAGISERFTLVSLIIVIVIVWYLFEKYWPNLSKFVLLTSILMAFIPIFFVDAVSFIKTEY